MTPDERFKRIDERLANIRKILEETAAMRGENEIRRGFEDVRDSLARLEAEATAALHRRRGVEGGL
jgi:hypothetical protein